MFKLKKPCENCPFRNDKNNQKGWLGEQRASDIYQSLKSGDVFPCHKTVIRDEIEDEDVGFKLQKQNQFCAGALIVMEKTKDANNSQAIQIGERLGMYDHKKLKMDSPVFNTEQEFTDWHKY